MTYTTTEIEIMEPTAPPDKREVLHMLAGLAGTIKEQRDRLERMQILGNFIWTECEAGRLSAADAIAQINRLQEGFTGAA